jgi:hypothetical protein
MENSPIISFIAEYWQFIFLYVFKYLKDIDNKLDTLHIDNAVSKTTVQHVEDEIKELKGWIKRLETDMKSHYS